MIHKGSEFPRSPTTANHRSILVPETPRLGSLFPLIANVLHLFPEHWRPLPPTANCSWQHSTPIPPGSRAFLPTSPRRRGSRGDLFWISIPPVRTLTEPSPTLHPTPAQSLILTHSASTCLHSSASVSAARIWPVTLDHSRHGWFLPRDDEISQHPPNAPKPVPSETSRRWDLQQSLTRVTALISKPSAWRDAVASGTMIAPAAVVEIGDMLKYIGSFNSLPS